MTRHVDHRRNRLPRIVVLAAAIGLVGCVRPGAGQESVEVTMRNLQGADVGVVELRDTSSGVLVRARFNDLPPGDHAFHIHEVGKCDPPFDSAGGHLHRGAAEHGFANPKGFHAGDLPNVHVPESGKATVEIFATEVRLSGGEVALLDGDGSALVLHAAADDYRTDPAGAAGARIACGVIKPSPK